jgi:hypothetical protein
MSIYEASGNLGTWLIERFETMKYESVYVSIGGKQTIETQTFNYPDKVKGNIYRNHSRFQMIPGFLRKSELNQLIIVIDNFSDKENQMKNHNILANIIKTYEMPRCHILLYDHYGTVESIISLIQQICSVSYSNNIGENNLMICNYIRFTNPNKHDCNFEDRLPIYIQKWLDGSKYKSYANCFYQWHGLGFFAYNLIFQYKTYNFARLSNWSRLVKMFELYFIDKQITAETDHVLFRSTVVDDRTCKSFDVFLKYNYDITSYRSEPLESTI